jgi:uracil permease
VKPYAAVPLSRLIPLSIQHVFAMFGATVLVPALTGLDPSTALLTSGLGTLLFQIITKGQVPAYLGSSFAFIAPIVAGSERFGVTGALAGCFVAGLVYVLIGAIIRTVGIGFIDRLFPPIVVGPVIMTIGLGLAGVAKDYSLPHVPTAIFTLVVVILVNYYGKGMIRVIPILIGIIAGYGFALFMNWRAPGLGLFLNAEGQNMFDILRATPWTPALPAGLARLFQDPGSSLLNPANWELGAIMMIAPVAVVTMIEHLGDVLTISRTTGRDFTREPGLHRTLWGDGLATSLAALLGGPPNTTYGENVGVLAITKVYNPIVVRGAAILVILFSLIPKFGALISTIPTPVMGGVTILLFGMIASVGVRTLVEKQVDLGDTRNLIIASAILILGISGLEIFNLQGMGLGAIAGVLLNLLLPERLGETRIKETTDLVTDAE